MFDFVYLKLYAMSTKRGLLVKTDALPLRKEQYFFVLVRESMEEL